MSSDIAAANLGRNLMGQHNGTMGPDATGYAMAMSGSRMPNSNILRSGFNESPFGVRFDEDGMVPPPRPGTNNDLMYIFWIAIVIGLF